MAIAAVILAAGKGKRMESDLPKVLHEIADRPMVSYVAETALSVGANPVILVVGHKAELVKSVLGDKYIYALQKEQKGTAHAVKMTDDILKEHDGLVLVLNGDVPLITKETLAGLLQTHKESKAFATVLTAKIENPFGYGRIVRDINGSIKIVEEKDATEVEKVITEINTGTFCFEKEMLFEAIEEVKTNNAQGEFYLTDVLGILNEKGKKVNSYLTENSSEVLGINTKEALRDVENIYLAKHP